MSASKPLIVDWKGLKKMGWPYSRAHTWRKMDLTIEVSRKSRNGAREVEVMPNPDPFPKCVKLGWHRCSHPVWKVSEVLAYFEAHGLQVSEDWFAS